MTNFVFYKLDPDVVYDPAVDFEDPAYAGPVGGGFNSLSPKDTDIYRSGVSPSGQYCYGGERNETQFVVNLSTRTLIYKHQWYVSVEGGGFEPRAIDDEGTLWGYDTSDSGAGIMSVAVDSTTASVQFTMTSGTDLDNGPLAIYPFTMPDETVFLVIFPAHSSFNAKTYFYTGTKGVVGLTSLDASTWAPNWAFQDDNGDIWVAGTSRIVAGSVSTMHLWRITDVASSAYDDLITCTMPSLGPTGADIVNTAHPIGFCHSGAFVGHWFLGTHGPWLFRADLTSGVVTTRDLGEDAYSAFPATPDPTHWFIIPAGSIGGGANGPNTRTFREIDPTDLTNTGTEYNLDQWEAGDDASVFTSWYVDQIPGFIGQQNFYVDADNHEGDFYIYTWGEGASDSSVLRVWGYSLDGHDFYVLRVRDEATFVYDLTTQQWAEWESPFQTKWRAHIGQNWIGMTETLAALPTDVVAGDDTEGTLWVLDPTAGRDDRTDTGSDPYSRIVTGGVQLTGRDVADCGALTIDLALGNPSQTGASITLEISDDWGKSWLNCGAITIAANDYTPVVEWRSLGQMKAPGRVFRLTDDGATVKIGGANVR